jgi:hypothetical protein
VYVYTLNKTPLVARGNVFVNGKQNASHPNDNSLSGGAIGASSRGEQSLFVVEDCEFVENFSDRYVT